MADPERVKEFPDISAKLAAPKRVSAFERERQEAVAKRQREEEETAAALKQFEDEFGVDSNDPAAPAGPKGVGGGVPGDYIMPPTGPSSFQSMAMPGAPPSLKRKRELEMMRERQQMFDDDDDNDVDDSRQTPSTGPDQFRRIDEAPKPTVQLSSLPRSITEETIRGLLKDRIPVYSVTLISPGQNEASKRSTSAIVTLEAGTTNAQIDNVVSALKDKYMGHGHFLSISRHLSSAALHPSLTGLATRSAEPFGAEMPINSQQGPGLRNTPLPSDYRGFAPPDSYDSGTPYEMPGRTGPTVTVRPPLELPTMRAIHIIADRLLSEPNTQRAMEMEALLMALPVVYDDERFAFLFDPRSPAGVYYRYLLWSDDDPDEAARESQRQIQSSQQIFSDATYKWVLPNGQVTFPDLTSLAEIVDDIDYASSDEESDDSDGERRFTDGRDAFDTKTIERQYITPLQRARLVHILCRLPTSHTMLRKGDVARVTSFAISHAASGAEDIVNILLMNVAKPFSYSLAAKYEDSSDEQDEEDEYEPGDNLPSVEEGTTSRTQKEYKRDDDPSSAKLVALYTISDILSASSTAGAKNAWKYRGLFEKGFELLKIFEYLGKLDKELNWGRIKNDQWKRRVGQIFDLWEQWSTFKKDVLDQLRKDFFEPPLSAEEKAMAEAEALREETRRKKAALAEKIQSIREAKEAKEAEKERVGLPGKDTVSVADVSVAEARTASHVSLFERENGGVGDGVTNSTPASGVAPPPAGRKRMRAEDMFADSEGED